MVAETLTATALPEEPTPLALECGQLIRHAIPPKNSATWQFEGEPGDVLSLHYLTASSISDTLINLQFNDGTLAQASGGTSDSDFQSFLLPQDATYSLTMLSDETGLKYEISLTCGGIQLSPSASPTPSPTPEPTARPMTESLRSRATEIQAAGDLVVYLLWQSVVDLDLHVIDPRGEEIFYENPRSLTGGILEYEANASCLTATTEPKESIFWKADTAPVGEYQVLVEYYGACDDDGAQEFLIGVWIEGALVQIIEGTIEPLSKQLVHEFSFD